MKRKKISIIGSGNIGGTLAHLIGMKNLGDVVLIDTNSGLSQAKSLDLNQSYIIEKIDCKVYGTDNYNQIRDSDAIVVTAGVTRKPGMDREGLLATNLKIIKSVADNINKYSPNSFVVVVTNPLDAMVWAMYKTLKIAPKMIVGMAGTLDSARFSYFMSQKLNISVDSISSLVIGGHGDLMLPLLKYSNVAGISINDLIEMGEITTEEIEEIITRTRKGGEEIVKLMGAGSAFYSPASSTICILDAYLNDKKAVLSCSAHLNGQYGTKDLFVGVPVIIGKDGVEKIMEVKFTEEENQIFSKSISHIRKLISNVNLDN